MKALCLYLMLILGIATPAVPARAQESDTEVRQRARVALNKGVEEFKEGRRREAIEFFIQATELDPTLTNARLYLGTAYADLYVVGDESSDNSGYARLAEQQFRTVLLREQSNISAIDSLGAILYHAGEKPFDPAMMEESKTYHEKHTQLQPKDPEPYYWIGVIDWALAYHFKTELASEYEDSRRGTRPVTKELRVDLAPKFRDQCVGTANEGIENMRKAIFRKPDYADAMAYLNLLYRLKADMETAPEKRAEYLRIADDLVDQAKGIMQKQPEQKIPQKKKTR
jgi:tetratricopeptide (TPR) repeat protein